MGMERRGNGFYFYTARRENGRVVRQYWGKAGGCELGRAVEWLDKHDAEIERDEQRARADEHAAIVAPVAKVGRDVRTTSDTLFLQASQALRAAGYHQPNRGRWRKKRQTKMETTETTQAAEQPTETTAAAAEAAEIATDTRTDWERACDEKHARQVFVVNAVNGRKGTEKDDQKTAIQIIKKHPADFVGIAETGTGISAVLDLMGANDVHKEIIRADIDAKRAELTGPEPSAMETLLVERVVVCWVFVGYMEGRVASSINNGVTFKNINCLNGLLDSANKRYMAALKTLAQVQRLKIPMNVQVNVAGAGGQQVNISGAVTTN